MDDDLNPTTHDYLQDAWAALDEVVDYPVYADALTPDQLTKVRRARDLLVEVLVELEETS